MNKKILSLLFIFILSLPFSGCSDTAVTTYDNEELPIVSETSEQPKLSDVKQEITEEKPETEKTASGNFTVHYIDVGQADSSLIICNGETMLIDGGNAADSSLIVSYLKKLGITHLDYMVCTHAHEDHVGGLSGPLNTVTVDEIYAPKTQSDIKAYTNFKTAALRQVQSIEVPKVGETVSLGGSDIVFLGPVTENYDDINNTSVVVKATFGSTSFLFMGDAEREAESDILATGADLKADVLKVGHHGSDYSSSYPFLREVMPKYAVISAGKGNVYGHPHEALLSRLTDAGAEIYRTDLQGDIIAESDGRNITFTAKKYKNTQAEKTDNPVTASENIAETAESQTQAGYIGNINTKKFHLPSCRSLPFEKNREYFVTRDEAVSKGYDPCKNCNP